MATDEFQTRQTPHSPEAERAVLGSMLFDASCAPDVIGLLKSSDFYSELNRAIYDTIFSMFSYSKTIDPVTVLNEMKSSGVWTESAPDYVLELMNLTPTSANVMEYAAIVRDRALLRAIANTGADITEMAVSGEGGAMGILDASEKKVYALRQDRSGGGLEPIAKVLAGVYESISEASKNGTGLPGLSTGLPDLDSAIMGLNKSDLIIIAARPGVGKTSIALNIALHAARESQKSIAFFSLEMSRDQLAMRLLSSESHIDNKKLQTGRVPSSDWKRLAAAAMEISKTKLLINDNPSLTVADMNAQCRRVRDLGLVVIDYLQLMQSATGSTRYAGENRTQVVSDISRMMKIMAKELNVPVICLSQLSRANESRANKRPQLSDLRESGSIEQDADIVIGLYREELYNANTVNQHVAECIILKNRRGETGKFDLLFQPDFTTYTVLDRKHTDGDA
ncbi:MAG: replicative DNA helicase [Oscillospiraceae bacterium]|jgi:replicative DNA helicase|nr:replicative DNA helicase [Oscillospiraceae bacterium]